MNNIIDGEVGGNEFMRKTLSMGSMMEGANDDAGNNDDVRVNPFRRRTNQDTPSTTGRGGRSSTGGGASIAAAQSFGYSPLEESHKWCRVILCMWMTKQGGRRCGGYIMRTLIRW